MDLIVKEVRKTDYPQGNFYQSYKRKRAGDAANLRSEFVVFPKASSLLPEAGVFLCFWKIWSRQRG